MHEHLVLAARCRRALRSDALGGRRRPALQRALVRVPGGMRHRADGLRRQRVSRPPHSRGLPHDRRRRARGPRRAAGQAAQEPAEGRGLLERLMEILYKDLDEPGLNTLKGYEKRGGYEMLRKALKM